MTLAPVNPTPMNLELQNLKLKNLMENESNADEKYGTNQMLQNL
jgi:hypothetical protein